MGRKKIITEIGYLKSFDQSAMTAMNKQPAFQFYPGDWRKDPGVQALDYEYRGIWLEILLLMHESEERGKLLLNGNPMPDEALARLLGLDKQKVNQAITTLLEYGVASRCPETGALMNRRMYRDEQIRQKRRQAGQKGGNPNLVNQKSSNIDNQKVNQSIKQKPTPSSSSSSSSSNKKESESVARARDSDPPDSVAKYAAKRPNGIAAFQDEQTEEVYLKYKQYMLNEKRHNIGIQQEEIQRDWLRQQPNPREILEHTMFCGYKKLVDPEKDNKQQPKFKRDGARSKTTNRGDQHAEQLREGDNLPW